MNHNKRTQKELLIFGLPLQYTKQDLETCMFGNVVKPENLSFDVVNAIGDLDIDYGKLRFSHKAMELIRSCKPNRFQESLLDVLVNINGDRKEGPNIMLLRDLMSVSGLSSLDGFTAAFDKKESFHFKLESKSIETYDFGRLILHATELKLEPKFNYAQLVGQSLLQAHYNREIFGDGDDTGVVTSFSLALRNFLVRFMTVRFPVHYLDTLKEGRVPEDSSSKPTVFLSQTYDLLKLKDRTAVVCALQGRRNMLTDKCRL